MEHTTRNILIAVGILAVAVAAGFTIWHYGDNGGGIGDSDAVSYSEVSAELRRYADALNGGARIVANSEVFHHIGSGPVNYATPLKGTVCVNGLSLEFDYCYYDYTGETRYVEVPYHAISGIIYPAQK